MSRGQIQTQDLVVSKKAEYENTLSSSISDLIFDADLKIMGQQYQTSTQQELKQTQSQLEQIQDNQTQMQILVQKQQQIINNLIVENKSLKQQNIKISRNYRDLFTDITFEHKKQVNEMNLQIQKIYEIVNNKIQSNDQYLIQNEDYQDLNKSRAHLDLMIQQLRILEQQLHCTKETQLIKSFQLQQGQQILQQDPDNQTMQLNNIKQLEQRLQQQEQEQNFTNLSQTIKIDDLQIDKKPLSLPQKQQESLKPPLQTQTIQYEQSKLQKQQIAPVFIDTDENLIDQQINTPKESLILSQNTPKPKRSVKFLSDFTSKSPKKEKIPSPKKEEIIPRKFNQKSKEQPVVSQPQLNMFNSIQQQQLENQKVQNYNSSQKPLDQDEDSFNETLKSSIPSLAMSFNQPRTNEKREFTELNWRNYTKKLPKFIPDSKTVLGSFSNCSISQQQKLYDKQFRVAVDLAGHFNIDQNIVMQKVMETDDNFKSAIDYYQNFGTSRRMSELHVLMRLYGYIIRYCDVSDIQQMQKFEKMPNPEGKGAILIRLPVQDSKNKWVLTVKLQ